MRNLFSSTLLALLLGAVSAAAQFEGVIEMKTTVSDSEGGSSGGGAQKIFLSKAGSRMEMDMQMAQAGMKMVILVKSATPKVMCQLNDGARTYTEIDLAKAQQAAAQDSDEGQYVVQKLGTEVILGYKTQHVRVINQKSPEVKMELWTAKDFDDSGTLSKMLSEQGGRSSAGNGLSNALKSADAEGMPLKTLVNAGDGATVLMEVVKVEKKSLPASTFEIPAGYKKSDGGIMDAIGGMTGPQADEVRQQLQEAMKNMTPEQRATMDKMMKQMKGGGQ